MKSYLVGLGNWTMGDDSIGLRIVEAILDRKLNRNFEAVDLAGSGINLIQYFNPDTANILIIDTVRAGKKPGEFFFFTPEDVSTQKNLANISTHEGDILKVIEFAKELRYTIPAITILGIEPETTSSGDLSASVKAGFERYLEAAVSHFTTSRKNF